MRTSSRGGYKTYFQTLTHFFSFCKTGQMIIHADVASELFIISFPLMFASLPRVWCAKCCLCGIGIRSCGSPLAAASPPHWRCLHFADISSETQEPNVSVTVQSNSNSGESFCQKPFCKNYFSAKSNRISSFSTSLIVV